MTRSEIRQSLRAIAEIELDWMEAELPAGRIADQFDSLQLMTLLVAVEDRFEIIFEPEDEERIETIDHLIEAIEEKHRG